MQLYDYFDVVDGKYVFRVGKDLDDELAKSILIDHRAKIENYKLMLEIIADFDVLCPQKDRELDSKVALLYENITKEITNDLL